MSQCTRQWTLRVLTLSNTFFRRCSTAAATSPPPAFPLKHVTRSNFETTLADLRRHVRDADFVAIDLEMTGITSAPWRESLDYDRFDVRYLKVKDSAEKFAVVQFGVCPFRWDSQCSSFIAHPHNFFVFPRQELLTDGSSREFLCQTTSLEFLAKYQFDFNACIHGGISYLSREQENEALKRLNMQYENEPFGLWHNLREGRDTPLATTTDVFFTERMKIKLGEWRDALLRDGKLSSHIEGTLSGDSSQPFQTVFFKMRPSLTLNGLTSHQLKLIHLVSKKHFKDLVYICLLGDNSCLQHFVVYTDSEHDKALLMKEVKDEHHIAEEMKIKNAIGFRRVIDLLSSEKKLIVGHNCFLDTAHIYSKFFGSLPSTAEEFATSIHKYFPQIIDTKVLLNAKDVLQMKNTSLSSAFSSLCPQIAKGSTKSGLILRSCVKVDVQVDDTRSSIWSSGAKHEAGYDAFMTGCIFAQACSHLGVDFKLLSPSENLAANEKLWRHVNLLYLSWTSGDLIELTTGYRADEPNNRKTRYPKISFEKIALIWGFPSKLKATEIKECLCKTFGALSVTSIYHIDETAVFVQFNKAELVSDFLLLKETLEKNNDVVSVLHPLFKLLQGGNTRAADYEAYKDICSSPISKIFFADQADAVGIKWKTKLVESKVDDTDTSQSPNQEIDESFHQTEVQQIQASNV